MNDDNEQLREDLARVTAERDEARAELMRRTAECDEVRARGRELRREVEALKAERDALRKAILDLERDDCFVHSEECDGRAHVAGDSCGSDGEGGWTCCEGLSERDCLATERSLCSCGLIVWRDRMRSAADLARGVRVVGVSRG